MASGVSTHKSRANVAQRTYIHNVADATVATEIAWVDLSLFGLFLATATLVSGTGVLTFRILASAAAAGTSSVEVKAHAAPTDADAAGDMLVLECSAQELAALGTDLRYVSVEMDCDHADDIVAVTYTRLQPKFAYADLTADYIS
jgi:hypothetical protein